MPNTGIQPAFAPTLPIRLLPHAQGYSISALTLGQVAMATQRIMNYAGYEAVHGSSPEFADLRSVGTDVLALSQLEIEPFEEGSFIIPARLSEDEIRLGERALSGVDVLQRFVDSMELIATGNARTVSIGMIQAVEELGKITRREAHIEYSAFGLRSRREPTLLVVDERYVQQATKAKTSRRSTTVAPNELTGRITAVDLVKFTFTLRVNDVSVAGNYRDFLKDVMESSLGDTVRVYGEIEYDHNRTPIHIHAYEVLAIS